MVAFCDAVEDRAKAFADKCGAIPGQWLGQYKIIARDLTAKFSDVNSAILRHTDLGWPRTTTKNSEKNVLLAGMLDFIAAVEKDNNTRTPMSEGAKTLGLVLTARESSETRQPVKIV